MPNDFSQIWVDKLQRGLLSVFDRESMTRWMEGNARGVEYKGGKYVTMRSIATDGAGDYSRSLGYPRGRVTGSTIQYEMKMDRGREFIIDVADHDEAGFVVTAASVMNEYQRNHQIPEVDAYRIGELYRLIDVETAGAAIDATAVDGAYITDTLIDDIATIRDEAGSIPLVIMMNPITQMAFGKEFVRDLNYQTFQAGSISTKFKSIDGDGLTIMPSRRLMTEYEFYDGVSMDEVAGGYAPTDTAEAITWMIVPIDAPIAVKKIDKLRVFTPDTFQDMHAWKTDYRIFHDLWLRKEKAEHCLVRTGAITPIA